MLSGLYAQASEGNAEAVKESTLTSSCYKEDETVREDIRQMNQLTLIEILEMKGLIMTKMLEAERVQIPFQLEVMFPVKRVPMAIEDLMRCVGILQDNAIEESRTQEGPTVTLLLLQEEWNEGYSTKDTSRGISLSNYQNIIRKYPNVTQEAKMDSEYFVRILVLSGKL